MKPGYERIHWLIDEAFAGDELSDTFLSQVMSLSSYADGPLFAALQEACYGSGPGATGWAAERERAAHPQFAETARPLLFTGEMIYPWMFEEIRVLRPFRAAVELLAARTEWSELYDLDRLAANDVPVAAAVYYDDMYVDSGLQLDTAGQGRQCAALGDQRVRARRTAAVRPGLHPPDRHGPIRRRRSLTGSPGPGRFAPGHVMAENVAVSTRSGGAG